MLFFNDISYLDDGVYNQVKEKLALTVFGCLALFSLQNRDGSEQGVKLQTFKRLEFLKIMCFHEWTLNIEPKEPSLHLLIIH